MASCLTPECDVSGSQPKAVQCWSDSMLFNVKWLQASTLATLPLAWLTVISCISLQQLLPCFLSQLRLIKKKNCCWAKWMRYFSTRHGRFQLIGDGRKDVYLGSGTSCSGWRHRFQARLACWVVLVAAEGAFLRLAIEQLSQRSLGCREEIVKSRLEMISVSCREAERRGDGARPLLLVLRWRMEAWTRALADPARCRLVHSSANQAPDSERRRWGSVSVFCRFLQRRRWHTALDAQ